MACRQRASIGRRRWARRVRIWPVKAIRFATVKARALVAATTVRALAQAQQPAFLRRCQRQCPRRSIALVVAMLAMVWVRAIGVDAVRTSPACLQLGRPNIYNRASCISNNGFCSTTCLINGAPNPEHCSDVAGLPTPAPTTIRPPAPTPITGSAECNLDRNTCTIESCVSGSGCPIAGNASPGVSCDDHNDCTSDDKCALFGRCAGTNNCPSNCSGHGSCCRSQCTCDKTYSGADCGTRSQRRFARRRDAARWHTALRFHAAWHGCCHAERCQVAARRHWPQALRR
jgi:hypothetical protein